MTDIVEDIYIYNNTLSKASDAARIKVWAGAVPNSNGSLPYGAGGGDGRVRNVTYDGMTVISDDCEFSVILLEIVFLMVNNAIDAIELTSCYSQTTANCNAYPVCTRSHDLSLLILAVQDQLTITSDQNDHRRRSI